MTLIDIIKLTLSQMGEDASANEISEHRTLLTAYINEAYVEICREKKQKYHDELLIFMDGRAAIRALSKEAVKILDIKDANNARIGFETVADQLFLNGQPDGEYAVSYLYLPERLSGDMDEPDLTERECYLLADFATYRGLGLGGKDRQKRSEFFLMRYLSGYSALGSKSYRISNKYD